MTQGERLVLLSKKQDAVRNQTIRIVESDPTYPIKLGDGKIYKLEYSYGPVRRVFQQTGLNLNLVQITGQDIGNPEVFEAILREGLRKHNPTMAGNDDLMDLVSMRHLSYYVGCVQLALAPTEPDPYELARMLDEIEQEANPQIELPLGDGPTSLSSGEGVWPVEFDPAK